MPGPFDYGAGRGTFAGVGKFASLAGVDLRAALSSALRTAPVDIRFLNDADAYALGEWDAQQRPDRLMCATLGTGVGGGFVEGGRVLTDDPRIPASGDFYHLAWRGEPLEDHVSRRAFIRDFGAPGLDVKEIATMALAGDDGATRVFRRGMSILAEVLAPWIDSFRPDVLVVGGAIARSWEVIGPALGSAITILAAHPPEVRPSRLQDEAPLIGAAEFVRSATPAQERNST
jgi:glucokinase